MRVERSKRTASVASYVFRWPERWMVAFGYSCDRWNVAQRLVQPVGRLLCADLYTPPWPGAQGRALLQMQPLGQLEYVQPCLVTEERRGFCPKCVKAWGWATAVVLIVLGRWLVERPGWPLSAAKQQHLHKASRSVNITRKDTKNCIFGTISVAKENTRQKDWKDTGKTLWSVSWR